MLLRQGVTLGVKEKMPRVPAVFEKRTKWRPYEAVDVPMDMDNYKTARDHAQEIEAQFEVERDLGAMIEVEEAVAREEYGDDLKVAALGALEKTDKSFRVVHDGTHKVAVNVRIRMRDQTKSPAAGELKKALRCLPAASFSLTGDVKRAHRLTKIKKAEWGLQACKTGVKPGMLWLNKCGTFGIASAAYHWARLIAGLCRCIMYMVQRSDFFQLLYADDFEWLAQGDFGLPTVALAIFFLVLMGTPFSWNKFRAAWKSSGLVSSFPSGTDPWALAKAGPIGSYVGQTGMLQTER
jgi:hypothetical protein